jgi:hypothetical protein
LLTYTAARPHAARRTENSPKQHSTLHHHADADPADHTSSLYYHTLQLPRNSLLGLQNSSATTVEVSRRQSRNKMMKFPNHYQNSGTPNFYMEYASTPMQDKTRLATSGAFRCRWKFGSLGGEFELATPDSGCVAATLGDSVWFA